MRYLATKSFLVKMCIHITIGKNMKNTFKIHSHLHSKVNLQQIFCLETFFHTNTFEFRPEIKMFQVKKKQPTCRAAICN